jgi:hypothetical protein
MIGAESVNRDEEMCSIARRMSMKINKEEKKI